MCLVGRLASKGKRCHEQRRFDDSKCCKLRYTSEVSQKGAEELRKPLLEGAFRKPQLPSRTGPCVQELGCLRCCGPSTKELQKSSETPRPLASESRAQHDPPVAMFFFVSSSQGKGKKYIEPLGNSTASSQIQSTYVWKPSIGHSGPLLVPGSLHFKGSQLIPLQVLESGGLVPFGGFDCSFFTPFVEPFSHFTWQGLQNTRYQINTSSNDNPFHVSLAHDVSPTSEASRPHRSPSSPKVRPPIQVTRGHRRVVGSPHHRRSPRAALHP